VKILRRTIGTLLLAGLFCVSAFAGALAAMLDEVPKIEKSTQLQQHEGAIFARDGHTLLRRLRAPGSRRYAKQSQISKTLANAVVAAEDRRFYRHRGIDPEAIARAALTDVRNESFAQGGSTITQQFVKNAYVGPKRTLDRKTREALLAVLIDARWTKQRILTGYLNTAYYGAGAYGVLDASRLYFGKPPEELNVAESALMAALLHAPSTDSPVASPQRARAARAIVLGLMYDQGMIDEANRNRALKAPLPDPHTLAQRQRGNEIAAHFVDMVVDELIERFGVSRALGGGLNVRTTLDIDMQRAAHNAVKKIKDAGPSSALVAVDVRSGEVRAMAIGGPAAQRAFNVAAQAERQPGSSFKPFALAAAIKAGKTLDSTERSAPFEKHYRTGVFKVSNDAGQYAGTISLRQATWHSDNTAYARLADEIGAPAIARAAHSAGITSQFAVLPAIVLGALSRGVDTEQMATAYATFANHGLRTSLTGGGHIQRVRDHGGKTLFEPGHSSRQALDKIVADLVTDAMQGVISHGTGTAAAIDRPAAGKTGTTESNADAWFVGFTPQLATAVWVGYPDRTKPMRTEYHGSPVFGGTFPAEIWAAFMKVALKDHDIKPFILERPTYVQVTVDSANDLLADVWCSRAIAKRFIKGQEPTTRSTDCPERARPLPDVVGMELGKAEALLNDGGFAYQLRETIGAADELGKVIDENPAAGTPVHRTDVVRLLAVTRSLEADAPPQQ
jgi:penicillin-binding protein 1A